MNNHQDKIERLNARLDALLKRQEFFSKEILELKEDIFRLNNPIIEAEQSAHNVNQPITEIAQKEDVPFVETETLETNKEVIEPPKKEEWNIPKKQPKKPKSKSDLEKFIGENLINKIGIIITVIGVAIGAKYSIENELISPLTRIILGYIAGFSLLAIGLKLKKNYTNYSAVLVSGAMAILYFITFSAYSFYELIPQALAFLMMFVFTGFTVTAALHYNKQIIAHIGLVGAYAVPFLLSNNSGNVSILFSYIAILNIGILFISFKKYWKPLYYVSFALTWLIFISWFNIDYETDIHFAIALLFSTLFFIIFYATFLSYKLYKKESFAIQDILLLLGNSFVYYGLGYAILSGHETGEQLLGLFTLANAIIHFAVGVYLYKQKLTDKNLFYITIGLVLVFVTLAIPVQLDGNWVTLFWVAEAALLFWLGRSKNISIYELISYPLMILALFSLFHDWSGFYIDNFFSIDDLTINPLFNVQFLSSLLFIGAFSFILFIQRKNIYKLSNKMQWLPTIFNFIVPAILIFTVYSSFRLEISNYFDAWYNNSAINLKEGASIFYDKEYNGNIKDLKVIWILCYSMLFFSILTYLNLKKIKNLLFGSIILGLSCLTVLIFLSQGLYVLSDLRESFIDNVNSEYFEIGNFNIIIRYISFVFLGVLIALNVSFIKARISNSILKKMFYLALHIVFVWILSSELIHWMDLADSNQSYKLGLSILWGVYSLSLIVYGIWKNIQFLRIGAIVLFGITLIKLFFYDIAHLNTISKTIVFVSLGVLLLLISFLYNKYKNNIIDEVEEES